ncbi:hypothetical protein B0H10DRAFT_1940662 [Mycena sp. CBHHK59/15]|nr:hypothetical protein B0H10DRAFT_1940662 [Mycena sp. CBHHK59/15]
MPESGVVNLNEREVGFEEQQLPAKVRKDPKEKFYGEFITHPECCAHVSGERQTFTVHDCPPSNPYFIQLPLHIAPVPPKTSEEAFYCVSCHRGHPDIPKDKEKLKPQYPSIAPAQYINDLHITGRIHAKARGKELVVVICNQDTNENYAFRVNFGTEAHCFWIPSE